MKFSFKKALSIAAVFSLLMLAACSELSFEPSAEETKEGYFTISLSANENTRAVYPPTDTSDLKFAVKFKDTESGEELTYTSDGSEPIQGTIDLGNYIVTMDVSLIADGSLYARGVAYDNPIEIGSGQNFIKVYAYDVNKAAPPVISEKPLGSQIVGGHTIKLPLTASVSDSGTLSYQWFSNTTDSNSGGTPVSTTQNFSSSPIWGGTAYYYAEITNTGSGGPSSIKTKPVKVSVNNGKGTVEDPFLVHDPVSLQKVGSGTDGWSLSAHYKQTADIDLSSVSNWTPIGTYTPTAPFTGIYDGDGKTISNLTINDPTDFCQGLFGYISSGAVVKNVGLMNCGIIGNGVVGGVVGYNEGTIQNCYATGNVSGIGNSVGGVAGLNEGTIRNCYATASVSCNGASFSFFVGGLVGYNTGTVQNCYATGNVSFNNEHINSGGGGVYERESNYAGGAVGANSGTVENCYATGSVYGSSASDHNNFLGGVVGYLSAGYIMDESTIFQGTVQNCVALNRDLSATNSPLFGRIVGKASEGSIYVILINNYGRGDMKTDGGSTTWTSIGSDDLDGASITSANWGSQSWWTTTAGWNFSTVWQWGGSLPILRNMPGTATQNPAVLP